MLQILAIVLVYALITQVATTEIQNNKIYMLSMNTTCKYILHFLKGRNTS